MKSVSSLLPQPQLLQNRQVPHIYATSSIAPKCTLNQPQTQTDTLLSTTSQVPLATISGHVATHKPATQCTTSFPSQYSEITASSLVEGEDTAKTAQASLSPEKSTPADETFPSPSPAAGTAEFGAGQKPQSTLHYAKMDFSKPSKMQPLPPPQLPQAMPSAQDYSEILMPIPAL